MPTAAEKFVKDNGAKLYDRVKVTTPSKEYEGIIMPKHRLSGEQIIVLKLDNGYNIGISVENAEMQILAKSKDKTEKKIERKNNADLDTISILGTCGTIASFVDYETGAVSPAITAEQLVNCVSALDEIANIKAEPLLSLASEDMKPEHWTKMAEKVVEIHKKENHGIIIGHGTDTMGYSSAALSFQLQELSNPIIFTGAQRSPDRPSSDAHLNLVGAAKAAMTDLGEVSVAMHETTNDKNIALWRGTRVRKNHTSKRDAFSSKNEGPLGIVKENVEWKQPYKATGEKTTIESGFEENIGFVWAHPGFGTEEWESITDKKKGIVIAGTGLGHINSELFGAIEKSSKDIPIAMTSQCLSGSTNLNVYKNGRELASRGVIELYDTIPETALVKMMWLAKHRSDNIEELMCTNLVGEISNSRKLE